MRIHVLGASLCLAFSASFASTADADFPTLLSRVPADANAIMLVDADKLFASPIAKREGWKKQQLAEAAQRPLVVPPQARQVVRAAHVDPHAGGPQWELALVELGKAPTVKQIADREKGYVDEIASTKVAWSPRGAYIVPLGSDTVGVLFPPNRQFLARWLKQPRGHVDDYLLRASQSMSATDAQVLLALDLADSVDPQQARAVLARVAAKPQVSSDPDALVGIVQSLHGAKLEIVLKDKAWGRLMLDFDADPAALAPIIKQLVTATLEHHQATLDDIDTWKVEVLGKSIALHGELGESSLMRLGSLFELPSIELDGEEPVVDAGNPKLYATQNHFKAVTRLINDLVAQKRDAKTYGQLGTWVEQYAKRIDRLPLVNVDPDMQQYSAGVAEDLRQIGLSVKGAGIRSGMQTAGLSSSGDSGYGWGNYDAYYGTRQVERERSSIRAQERGTSMLDSSQLAARIRADTSKIRQQMTQRYHVEF